MPTPRVAASDFHADPAQHVILRRRRTRSAAAALAVALVIAFAACTAAHAQNAQRMAPGALTPIAPDDDRTSTNPSSLRDTFEIANVFSSVDEGLFIDHASWSYAQGFLSRRLRARATLPMVFANVTGRTEAGLADVSVGAEWLGLQRGRAAVVVGADASFDTSTNDALADRVPTLTPHATVVVTIDARTLITARYAYRRSLRSESNRPDIAASTVETTAVHRFAHGMWIRLIPALVIDHEREATHRRLDAEWGRVLAAGISTWIRGGRTFGADEARPDRWTIATGIRLVL